ncbi:GIY-YIG nuclease family protein [Brevundimonas sp. Leaf363]|uniref:GIY-YIG nuclease family protein n=1 Tax=Brevundimonas sp. Leaf363 TaxID=1736353 RepID=UPI00350F9B29
MRDPDHLIGVYIMASRRNGTIYTGVSGQLVARVAQHRAGAIQGFTKDYGCKHSSGSSCTSGSTRRSAARSRLRSGGGRGSWR